MRLATLASIAAIALTVAGCVDHETGPPRDRTPPAAPRGVYSVTGDHQVTVNWLDNTESDVEAYWIFIGDCDTGANCPYDRVGTTTGTSFVVTGLANGVTKYFAVKAIDHAGNESELSYETVFDTARPAGSNASIGNFLNSTTGAGWDFSLGAPRDSDDPLTDMFFGYNGSIFQLFVPDFQTDIQDAGYATSLNAVDFAPNAGWSPTGSVEVIVGHCYVVWTRDNHYAKFRVTSVSSTQMVFDWAYQTDTGNRELRVRPVHDERTGARPVVWLR